MKTKTHVKAGAYSFNDNERLVRDADSAKSLKVKKRWCPSAPHATPRVERPNLANISWSPPVPHRLSSRQWSHVSSRLLLQVIVWGVGLLGICQLGWAAEFVCPAGDVACLIDSITAANANDEESTITLAAGTYTLRVADNETDGLNGLPSISGPLTIRGAGPEATIVERAADAPAIRLMHVATAGRLTLDGLTLKGGGLDEAAPTANEISGGALFNHSGTVIISDSTIMGNGGANALFNSTLFNPSVVALMTLRNSTLADNFGTGLHNFYGTVRVTESTIAGNGGVALLMKTAP
jgi:hypothetical protein